LNKKSFSLVIPCFNSENSIHKLIDNIFIEVDDFIEFDLAEIICVDDCSKDETKNIIKNIQNKRDKVLYLSNNKNLGQVKSTLKGIKYSTGQYIVTLDDDGQHPPSEITKLLSFCSNNKFDFVNGYWTNDETKIRNISSIIANYLISILIFRSPKYRITAFRCIDSSIKDRIQKKFKYSKIMDLRKVTNNFGSIEVLHNSNPLNRKFSNFYLRLKLTLIYLLTETYLSAILIIFFLINYLI
tara:strand:+ start:27606 stop:28328 length:723 start_codon:yes stop_codon:yes gene_type:complete